VLTTPGALATDADPAVASKTADKTIFSGGDRVYEDVGKDGDRGGSPRPVAYVISAVEGFVDEETVMRYAELAAPAIEHFRGRFIVSMSEPVVVEGESPARHLSIVEFPSIEEAKAWYDSPQYAEARILTPATFRGRVLMFVDARPPERADSAEASLRNRV
jgi:uncharacterized protein (DUF1330 family)